MTAPVHQTPDPRTLLHDTRWERILVVVGIVVLGFNLRPAAVSVGPVLSELRGALDMSPVAVGLLTSLPVLAFAGFGGAAPWLAGRVGVHRLTLFSLVAVVVGLGLRSLTSVVPLFLLMSLVALAGMAAANILLPSLVKLHFPDRVGLMTSLYTTALAVGLTSSSALTVPISDLGNSWRWGLGAWACTALVAALPWIGLVGHDTKLRRGSRTVGLAAVARTRLGWAMAMTFALQSTQAYTIFGWFAELFRDSGYSASEAGLLLAVVTGTGIPLSFAVPYVAGRLQNQAPLILALLACYVVGYLGLLLTPETVTWLWAALVGAGTSIFPLVLVLIGLRARTPEGTAALSGFTQSVGYLLAAPGPFLFGVLHDRTEGWDAPLVMLLAINAALTVTALFVARPQYIEDQLPA
ncbi:MAG TPA: MFS transporter [Nocardioidaceae bacterium]|nr:MFS transporter [Nocardioidaceae bacterium]